MQGGRLVGMHQHEQAAVRAGTVHCTSDDVVDAYCASRQLLAASFHTWAAVACLRSHGPMRTRNAVLHISCMQYYLLPEASNVCLQLLLVCL